MSEIEKAREEQDAFRLREQAADARVIAAREKASAWSAKIEKAAEDRIREIAREEIEAAKGARPIDPDWRCPACWERECRGHGVVEASSLNWREFTALDAAVNQEGGDPHSTDGRPAGHAGNKSPPAVEAPAAGDDDDYDYEIRKRARIGVARIADNPRTTALARRLAEELSKIAGHVVVSETAIEALTEARKAGLIE